MIEKKLVVSETGEVHVPVRPRSIPEWRAVIRDIQTPGSWAVIPDSEPNAIRLARIARARRLKRLVLAPGVRATLYGVPHASTG